MARRKVEIFVPANAAATTPGACSSLQGEEGAEAAVFFRAGARGQATRSYRIPQGTVQLPRPIVLSRGSFAFERRPWNDFVDRTDRIA